MLCLVMAPPKIETLGTFLSILGCCYTVLHLILGISEMGIAEAIVHAIEATPRGTTTKYTQNLQNQSVLKLSKTVHLTDYPSAHTEYTGRFSDKLSFLLSVCCQIIRLYCKSSQL